MEKTDLVQKSKVVFFDLGDTLIYFTGNWPEVIRESTFGLWKKIVKSGFSLSYDQFSLNFSQRMRNYYLERNKNLQEYTSAQILEDCLRDFGYEIKDKKIITQAMTAMYSISQKYWMLEEETKPVLQWIRENGFRIGLISNASDKDDVYTLLKKHELTQFFEHIIISAEFGLRKPHKNIFLKALGLFNAQPSDCFMVGDRLDMDILGANQVGIHSIWITKRSAHKDIEDQFEEKPEFTIDSLTKIKDILYRATEKPTQSTIQV